jgi:hypothetical protein
MCQVAIAQTGTILANVPIAGMEAIYMPGNLVATAEPGTIVANVPIAGMEAIHMPLTGTIAGFMPAIGSNCSNCRNLRSLSEISYSHNAFLNQAR